MSKNYDKRYVVVTGSNNGVTVFSALIKVDRVEEVVTFLKADGRLTHIQCVCIIEKKREGGSALISTRDTYIRSLGGSWTWTLFSELAMRETLKNITKENET